VQTDLEWTSLSS